MLTLMSTFFALWGFMLLGPAISRGFQKRELPSCSCGRVAWVDRDGDAKSRKRSGAVVDVGG